MNVLLYYTWQCVASHFSAANICIWSAHVMNFPKSRWVRDSPGDVFLRCSTLAGCTCAHHSSQASSIGWNVQTLTIAEIEIDDDRWIGYDRMGYRVEDTWSVQSKILPKTSKTSELSGLKTPQPALISPWSWHLWHCRKKNIDKKETPKMTLFCSSLHLHWDRWWD